MANLKQRAIGKSLRWHRALLWFAASALLVWGGSGLLHPLMSVTGPQPVAMLPPALSLPQNALTPLSTVLVSGETLERIQWVASPDAPLLQVTVPSSPVRRYVDALGQALPEATDETQAIWLARHFTGNSAGVHSTELLTAFDDRYPWVNRQLPVWRVQFADAAATTAYIHTETATLASLTDANKEVLQTAFRWLHTLSWLDSLEPVRLGLGGLWVGALLVTVLAGLALLVWLRRRQPNSAQRWHRRLAWLVVIPLLAMTVSGLHHLVQMSAGEQLRGQTRVLPLVAAQKDSQALSLGALADTALRDISLVPSHNGVLLRAAAMPLENTAPEHRFHGVRQEAAISYQNLVGERLDWDDLRQARWLATQLLGVTEAQIESATLVTHFGPTYDFRNKRLPVWELTLKDAPARLAYIDTRGNRVVDQLSQAEIVEALDFGLLHKWNWLGHSIGRGWRDLIQVALVLLALGVAALGIALRRRAA